MAKMNHESNNRRMKARELTRSGNYERVVRQKQNTRKQQQEQLARFARAHQDQAYCRSIAEQVASGRPITKGQAAVLWQISSEHGWPVRPTVGARIHDKRQRERSQPGVRTELQAAREAVLGYTGPDGWIEFLRREFAGDPDWLPTVKQARAIMSKVDPVADRRVSS